MAKNHVPADDGLVTDAFVKLGRRLAAVEARPAGGGGGGIALIDNGDGTAILTLAAGSASLVDNGDGTATLTI